MIECRDHFFSDSHHVCNQFLRKLLHLSNNQQQRVRMSVATALPQCVKGRDDSKELTNNLTGSRDQNRTKSL